MSAAGDSATSQDRVDRRHLFRGGVVAAGVAAGAVVAGAVAPRSAHAADGETVVVGGEHDGVTTTSLGITDGNPSVPTLELINENGPALSLPPVREDWDPSLTTGQIANTAWGPMIGVGDAGGPFTTYLATGLDLDALPVPVAITPTRLLDTRTSAGRANVVRRSSGSYDSQYRLTAGAWLDLAVDVANADFTLHAAFVNLTTTRSSSGGYLAAYPPGPRPVISTVSFTGGQTIANGAFVALDVVEEFFALRIYASTASHVIVDLTGASVAAVPGPLANARAATQRRSTTVRDQRRTARPRPTLAGAGPTDGAR